VLCSTICYVWHVIICDIAVSRQVVKIIQQLIPQLDHVLHHPTSSQQPMGLSTDLQHLYTSTPAAALSQPQTTKQLLFDLISIVESNSFGLFAGGTGGGSKATSPIVQPCCEHVSSSGPAVLTPADGTAASTQPRGVNKPIKGRGKHKVPAKHQPRGAQGRRATSGGGGAHGDGGANLDHAGPTKGPTLIGRVLYPLASFFNHSCAPNCHSVQVHVA